MTTESKCVCGLCSLVKRGSQMGMSCSYSPRSTRRPLLPKRPEREQPRRRERTAWEWRENTANSLLGIVCLRLSLSLMLQKTVWESQEHVTFQKRIIAYLRQFDPHCELSLNPFILEKKNLTDILTHDAHAGDVGSNLNSFEQVLLVNWFWNQTELSETKYNN